MAVIPSAERLDGQEGLEGHPPGHPALPALPALLEPRRQRDIRGVDVRDERIVSRDDAPHFVYDSTQPFLYRALDLPECVGWGQ